MEAVPANGHAEGTALTPAQHAYYVGYIAVLVACFTPFKLLAYTLPTLFTAWMLYSAYTPAAGNRLAKIALVAAGIAVLHEILGHPFILSNYLIALVTFSAALPILVLDARSFGSRELLQRMLLATTVMILIQGIWGSVQGINEAIHRGTFGENVGDWVEGTIHPALAAEMAGSNPMFAINMALMLIACLSLPGIFTGKRTKALVIGTFSFVLASVVHVFIFLIAAGALSVVLLRRARTVAETE
ncbi:MAG TPA: hypothetical protein VLT45_17745, partial [Kofleriaceae bacterium]|nr:hypothetical protein [Kofleriaceae bacterium]